MVQCCGSELVLGRAHKADPGSVGSLDPPQHDGLVRAERAGVSLQSGSLCWRAEIFKQGLGSYLE